MTQAQMRDMRRTALSSMLNGWTVSLALITMAANGAHCREDIVLDQTLFTMFAVIGTSVGGTTIRGAGFVAGYLLTTLVIIGMFLFVPLPAQN